MELGGGAFEWRLGHDYRALTSEISAYSKEGP